MSGDESKVTHDPSGWRELFAERLRNEITAREKCDKNNAVAHGELWSHVRKNDHRLTIIETRLETLKESKTDIKWVVTTIIAVIAAIVSAIGALT